MKRQYSIVIQWSNEDKKYIVSLPEFGPYAHTHGFDCERFLSVCVILTLIIGTLSNFKNDSTKFYRSYEV